MFRCVLVLFFFFQAEDGIRDYKVTGVQTCALPISLQNRDYLEPGVNKFTTTKEKPRSPRAPGPVPLRQRREEGSSVVKTSADAITAHSADRNGLVYFAGCRDCKAMPDKRGECSGLTDKCPG